MRREETRTKVEIRKKKERIKASNQKSEQLKSKKDK